MAGPVNATQRNLARAQLLARVRAPWAQLVGEIVGALPPLPAGSPAADDAEYLAGLTAAVGTALEYAIDGIERGGGHPASVPPSLVAQAHRAARAGLRAETLVRRYLAGSTLLADRIVREAENSEPSCPSVVLREVLALQAALLDVLIAVASTEHALELERLARSPQRRRTQCIQEILAGASHIKSADLDYELDGWHIGLIATGRDALEALRSLATRLKLRMLWVPRGEETLWAWVGAGQPLSTAELEQLVCGEGRSEGVLLTVGEPSVGLEGFRLTHRQAQAALHVALCTGRPLTRYADVALLACVLRDQALAGSIVEIYLSPLGPANNGGATLRQTLRAYLDARGNASSAASALGVARHTVENRLRQIEAKLGQRLRTHQTELDVALRLEALAEGVEAVD